MALKNVTKNQKYKSPCLIVIELNEEIDCLRSSMDNFVDAPDGWAESEQ